MMISGLTVEFQHVGLETVKVQEPNVTVLVCGKLRSLCSGTHVTTSCDAGGREGKRWQRKWGEKDREMIGNYGVRVAVGPERTGTPFRFFFGQPERRSCSFFHSSQQCIRKWKMLS